MYDTAITGLQPHDRSHVPIASASAPSGYSAWRLIAEELRREIVEGSLPAGAKLPSETKLAQRFGVNRHTVRHGVAQLAADGLLIARRGSGTYVAEHGVLVHRIGMRTRLSDSLGRRGETALGRLLDDAIETDPPPQVEQALALDGRPALRLETVRTVGDLAITRSTHWFDAGRVPGLERHFRRARSLTPALRAVGIEDYVRASTSVAARLATSDESADLDLPAGAVVLVVRSVDTLPDGTPLQFGVTRLRADRVELDVEHPLPGDHQVTA